MDPWTLKKQIGFRECDAVLRNSIFSKMTEVALEAGAFVGTVLVNILISNFLISQEHELDRLSVEELILFYRRDHGLRAKISEAENYISHHNWKYATYFLRSSINTLLNLTLPQICRKRFGFL